MTLSIPGCLVSEIIGLYSDQGGGLLENTRQADHTHPRTDEFRPHFVIEYHLGKITTPDKDKS